MRCRSSNPPQAGFTRVYRVTFPVSHSPRQLRARTLSATKSKAMLDRLKNCGRLSTLIIKFNLLCVRRASVDRMMLAVADLLAKFATRPRASVAVFETATSPCGT